MQQGVHFCGDGISNASRTAIHQGLGAKVLQGVSVEGVSTRGGRVCGVRTSKGDVACEYVVNCAGMWARQLGERDGVSVPLQAAEHYYLITEPFDGISPDLPVLEVTRMFLFVSRQGFFM